MVRAVAGMDRGILRRLVGWLVSVLCRPFMPPETGAFLFLEVSRLRCPAGSALAAGVSVRVSGPCGVCMRRLCGRRRAL